MSTKFSVRNHPYFSFSNAKVIRYKTKLTTNKNQGEVAEEEEETKVVEKEDSVAADVSRVTSTLSGKATF